MKYLVQFIKFHLFSCELDIKEWVIRLTNKHIHLLQVDNILDDYENDQFVIHTHSETKINKGICDKCSKHIPTLHSDRDSENASVGLSNDNVFRTEIKTNKKEFYYWNSNPLLSTGQSDTVQPLENH